MASTIPVKRNAKGVWYSRLYLGKDSSGRKIQKQKSFPEAETEAEARLAAAEWAAGLTAGGKVQSMGLPELLDGYIDMRELNGAAANSVKQWRCFNRCYIRQFLSNANAAELTALDFTRFSGEIMRHGGRDGGRLSANTVNAVQRFLRSAYRYLVSVGIVETNPLLSTVRPKVAASEAFALDAAAVEVLRGCIDPIVKLDVTASGAELKCATATWIALHTGMRCGEICALRPKDIHLDRRFIHVGGTVVEPEHGAPYRCEQPKSSHSRRNISITEAEARVLDVLIAVLAAENDWATDSTPVVSSDGSWSRPSSISTAFKRLCNKLAISSAATFHTLRHTHASWCIANGVDYITISERLGHASPTTTMRIYGHLMAGRDEAAAEIFNKALEGGGDE